MVPYTADRIGTLANVRCVLAGGGWTNRTTEALKFVETGLDLINRPHRVLILPTPTSEPCDEGELLRLVLQKYSHLEISEAGKHQAWPDADNILIELAWANVVVIPGGNFPTYMSLIGDAVVRDALRQKFLSGDAVFIGSSNGTVSWFDRVHTADRPISEGGDTYDEYRTADGIGAVLPGMVSAHFNERHSRTGLARATLFQDALRTEPPGTIGFGIDTQAAFVLDNGRFRVETRDRYAHIQRGLVLQGGELRLDALKAGSPELALWTLYCLD